MVLSLYVDFASQPCRAVVLFARASGIEHEVKELSLFKGESNTAEFKALNPKGGLPFMDHDGFRLSESVAIIKYMASAFKVDNHWYPKNLKARARVDEALAWQHSALKSMRQQGCRLTINKLFGPLAFNQPFDEAQYQTDSTKFKEVLATLESYFLNGTEFMGSEKISIADVLTSCEATQVELSGSGHLFDDHPKSKAYLDRVKDELKPHWAEMYAKVKPVFDEAIQNLAAKK